MYLLRPTIETVSVTTQQDKPFFTPMIDKSIEFLVVTIVVAAIAVVASLGIRWSLHILFNAEMNKTKKEEPEDA